MKLQLEDSNFNRMWGLKAIEKICNCKFLRILSLEF